MSYKNLIVLLTILLILPNAIAELQPAFLDQNIHFLGEEITFGLVGIIPDDFNNAKMIIELPNNYVYQEAELNLENLSDYYFAFPYDFIYPQVKVKYIYYNSNNTETLTQEYLLQLAKLPNIENIKYCINIECNKTTYEMLDQNEIYVDTETEIIDENISFDIIVVQEGYIIENAINQKLPYYLGTIPGDYEIKITPKYNDIKFETKSLYLNISKTQEEKITLEEYLAEIKEQESVATIENVSNNTKDTTTEKKESKNLLLYIGVVVLIVIIILTILFSRKPKEKENKDNRRQSRKERGFVLFFVFIFCLSSIHAMSLEEKTIEYQNLEIKFDEFQEMYPKPLIFPIPISNTQPKNTIYYPLSATGINDLEKITPTLENKTKNLSVSLESVYLSININEVIEKAKEKNEPLQLLGCEQVLEWYQKNPITDDPNTLVKRTKERLLEEINITENKNNYTEENKEYILNKNKELNKNSKYKNSKNPFVEYCITEALTKQKSILGENYLIEKKILLKIEYEEKNQEAITSEEATITDNIIFLNNKNKDVLENSFLGSDLEHIVVYVDYVNDVLTEQNIVFEGINKDQLITDNQIIDDEKATHYLISNLEDNQELTIKYTAQLINLEIADSEYGRYYRFENNSEIGPEKKGYEFLILDKNISKIRNKLISNVELIAKIKLNNEKYEIAWDTKTLNLLAEINLDSTKYLILDKKILIDVGDQTNGVSIGIDKDYGIISSDVSDIKILLEEDKTINFSQTPNNLHLEALKKTFLKTSTQKNLELIRLQLPFLFIFNFKKNAQTITNEDELYLKTYDDLANLLNETKLTKIEKNILFNNLISLTEDFSFQQPGEKIYKFGFKTRLVLNNGLVKYIDNPKTIANLSPENIGGAIPYLYDNDYLERKGFVDKSLTELLVLGYLGENYLSENSKRDMDPKFDNLAAYEYDLKSQMQQMFVTLKADSQNWGYYKQLLSYPFYRSGFEQKICSYDKDNFPKYAIEDYCYVAYNLNPDTDNWGILYDSDNLESGFLMQAWGFQNNYVSAYRTILLFEDIESFKNNKLTFNQNQLKTFNKLNAFFNLIELEAIRNRGTDNQTGYTDALILSYKLKELWNSNTNELKEYDAGNNIGAQIDAVLNVLTYQATVKLRSTIATDKVLRLDAYKSVYQTDAHRYEVSTNPSAGFFDLSDSARFLITGGWFQTLIFKGTENEIKKIEDKEREKYNKILHGTCCISQRLGELEPTYRNWKIEDIKNNFSPYSKSKSNKTDTIGWVTDGTGCIGTLRENPRDCAEDIKYLYSSIEYGNDISIILNDRKDKKSISNYLTAHYVSSAEIFLGIDLENQLKTTERELAATITELKPGAVGSILRFIDAGFNPAAIVITFATVGIGHGLAVGTSGFFTRIAAGFGAKWGSSTVGSLASTVGTRVLYELGENIVIDGAYGALVYAYPDVAGKHPFLTCIILGITIGNFNRPLSNIDSVARGMATDIITNNGLKNADNLKIQGAVKNALNLDYKDTTSQLLKLRKGESATDAFFRRLPKIAEGAVDDDLVKSIQKNLLSQKIAVSEDVIRKSLGNNNLYLTTRATAVSKFFKSKQGIKLNQISAANLDGTSNKFVKLVTERTNPERLGIKFTSIVDEFEDLKRFNEIDPEHFAKPTKIVYDDLGNPIGYEMDRVYGVTLADYIESGEVLDDSFYKRIEDSVEKLHQQGYAHGDINPYNVIIIDGYDGLDFKIIDPVGFRRIADNVNLRAGADSLINDDILKARNLKNFTPATKMQFGTNYILNKSVLKTYDDYTESYWNNQNIDNLIPIRRTDGKITLARPRIITASLMEVEFIEGGVKKTKTCNIATEVFAPIKKGDLIYVDAKLGAGIITNVEEIGRITYQLPNGRIAYADVTQVINSRSSNFSLNKVNPNSLPNFQLINSEKLNWWTMNEKAQTEFLSVSYYHNASGGMPIINPGGREIIFISKNDKIIKTYLENVRIKSASLNRLEKLELAQKLVKETFPFTESTNIKLNGHDVLIDGTKVNGEILPLSYFMINKTGTCRHHSLLMKLTLDEMGINSVIIDGSFTENVIGGITSKHYYNLVDIGSERKIIDSSILDQPVSASFLVDDPVFTPKGTYKYNYGFCFYDLQITNRSGYIVPKNYFSTAPHLAYSQEILNTNYKFMDVLNQAGVIEKSEFVKYGVPESHINEMVSEHFKRIEEIYYSDSEIFRGTFGGYQGLNLKNRLMNELTYKGVTINVIPGRYISGFNLDKMLESGSNNATLIYHPTNPVINIAEELIIKSDTDNPAAINAVIEELRHEYGAYKIAKVFGSKDQIPRFILRDEYGNYMTKWSTHYLDGYSKEPFNYNYMRKYVLN